MPPSVLERQSLTASINVLFLNGALKKKEDFQELFDKVKKFTKGNFYTHFSGVEHEDGNEIRYTPIKKGDLKFEPLAECILDNDYDMTIISGSPLLEHDAMYMKVILERVLAKREAKAERQKIKEAEKEAEEAAKAKHFCRHFEDSLHFSWARTPAYAGVDFINVLAPEVSKGKALEALALYLGVAMSDVMAVGDGPNDIPLLSAAGLAVAMGNAMDELRAVADYVTLDVKHSGLAAAVEKFLLC